MRLESYGRSSEMVRIILFGLTRPSEVPEISFLVNKLQFSCILGKVKENCKIVTFRHSKSTLHRFLATRKKVKKRCRVALFE